jgi:hypothetical protein
LRPAAKLFYYYSIKKTAGRQEEKLKIDAVLNHKEQSKIR